ncbi:hypothetical protein D3C72_2018400 [compost metagenome]
MKTALRVAAWAGWLGSLALSGMIWTTLGFASNGGLSFSDHTLSVQILLLSPFIAVVASGVVWLLKRRSPWLELSLLTAPLYQIVFVACRLSGGGSGSPN